MIKGNRRDCRRCIVANPRQLAQRRRILREIPARPFDDKAGAGRQVAGPGVITEPLPFVQHLIETRRSERANIGPARHQSRQLGRPPGLRAVGPLASRLAAPVVAGHGGGILARLKADWPAVIGADIAAATWPQALGRDGVLKLRVAAATALELQHRAPLLIERINVYLGRPAISRLVFVQGPLPLAPPARRGSLRQLRDAEAEAIERQIAAIGDSELKAALARLGKSVASSAARRR